MTASSDTYIRLQQIYRAKAEIHLIEIQNLANSYKQQFYSSVRKLSGDQVSLQGSRFGYWRDPLSVTTRSEKIESTL